MYIYNHKRKVTKNQVESYIPQFWIYRTKKHSTLWISIETPESLALLQTLAVQNCVYMYRFAVSYDKLIIRPDGFFWLQGIGLYVFPCMPDDVDTVHHAVVESWTKRLSHKQSGQGINKAVKALKWLKPLKMFRHERFKAKMTYHVWWW